MMYQSLFLCTYFMLPLPLQSTTTSDKGDKGDKGDKPTKRRTDGANDADPKRKKKGAGKGKRRDPVPEALKGKHSRTPKNEPICFAYNLNSCKKGSSCPRKHVCAVPGCYQQPPQSEHK